MTETPKIKLVGIMMWTLGVLFYFYEFFLRIFLGTIATEVMFDLKITVEQFSLIGAGYYITYGLMQVPVGLLTEKIGARVCLTLASGICALGVFFLAFSQGFYMAFFSRLLIGFGSSFAFVTLLILSLNWFPRKYFGFFAGLSTFLGAIGPMVAGAPLAYVVQLLNGRWRLALHALGIFGIVLTVVIGLLIRGKPIQAKNRIIFLTPTEPLKTKLLELMKNFQVWLVILFSGCTYLVFPLMAAYWGTAYLESRGFEKTLAAFIVSMIWLGYAIASPILGKVSDRAKRRKVFLYSLSLFGFVFSAAILYLPIQSATLLSILFFLLGFSSSCQILSYAVVVENVSKKLQSAAIGLNNSAAMLFGALFPALAGSIIQMSQIGPTLTPGNFSGGLTILPICYLIAFLTSLFGIKETFCRQQQEVHIVKQHKASDLYS